MHFTRVTAANVGSAHLGWSCLPAQCSDKQLSSRHHVDCVWVIFPCLMSHISWSISESRSEQVWAGLSRSKVIISRIIWMRRSKVFCLCFSEWQCSTRSRWFPIQSRPRTAKPVSLSFISSIQMFVSKPGWQPEDVYNWLCSQTKSIFFSSNILLVQPCCLFPWAFHSCHINAAWPFQ